MPALQSPSLHSVPASYALQLVQLVSRWNIPAEELLDGVGLIAADLEEPCARLPLVTMNALTARARTLTGEPGLGFYLGLHKRISMYGFLGFAMMTAATVRECLELAVKFSPVVTTAVTLRLEVADRIAALVVEEHVDMGDVHDVALISLLIGLTHLGTALTGRSLPAVAEVAMPMKAWYPRFAHLATMRFDRPVTQVLFDAAFLDVPVATADRAALRLARERCEEQLEALGFDAQIGTAVRQLLWTGTGLRSLTEVAAGLGVSSRTLARRLGAHGLSFSALVDQARRERANLLLRSPELSLEDISERLGYSTTPNFIRAFHRWTGVAPAAYRGAQWGSTGGPPAGS